MWSLCLSACSFVPEPVDPDEEPSVDDVDPDPTDPGDEDPTDEDPDDEDPDDNAAGDEALVRGLVDGTDDAGEVFETVSWSGGWPVATSTGTFLFVVAQGGDWQLAGDFNGWTPEPMTAGDGFSWAEVAIAEPLGQGYKFVDSNGDYWADPSARSYTYDTYGELSYVRPSSTTWHLEWWPDLESPQGLAPRSLRVYVPAGTGPWPVLYVHDGQNLYDPNGIWGGWHLQDAMATLSEPALLVGIDNTVDRMDEYTHVPDDLGSITGGDGDLYAAFLQETVRPFVEQTYGSTGLDGLLGSSLGGLISLHVADRYPLDFDFAASLSGTLGWGRFGLDNDTMQERYLAAGVRDFVVYVDSGGDDGDGVCEDSDGDGFWEDDPDDSDNYCANRQFADALADAGYTWDEDLFHWHEPGAPHQENAWAARVDRPLGLFLALDD